MSILSNENNVIINVAKPVKVSQLRKIKRFTDILALIPADVTGFDFGPFYSVHVADTQAKRDAILTLELSWQPDRDNPGIRYNGPVGEFGLVLSVNDGKWRQAFCEHSRRNSADFKVFVSMLPANWQTINSWELAYTYLHFVENACIVDNLEKKHDTLASILDRVNEELRAEGLKFEDLAALRNLKRDRPVLSRSAKIMPDGYDELGSKIEE